MSTTLYVRQQAFLYTGGMRRVREGARCARRNTAAMSQENVDLVRGSFHAWLATGDLGLAALDESIVVFDHDILDAGEYRGVAGVERWLVDWSSAWSEFTMDPEEFIDAGDRVIAVIRMRATGRGSGVELERQDAMVYELRAGRIARLDYYNNLKAALEAVGLAG
jgi:ketosteroid isomerase-like protein